MAGRKIRLVEPGGRPGRPFNAWISRWPLLGPVILGSVLERRGYDVAVYNENVSGPVLDDPAAMEDLGSSDVVGISIMTPTAARGYEIAGRLRQSGGRPRIVFGGVHATFEPLEALAHGDIVVRGEGESVIEAVASGQVREGIVQGEPLPDLDVLPPLNYFLMRDFDRLVERSRRRRELYELPVMTSRGCPYQCRYCTVTQMFGRRVRRQSVRKVHEDLCRYAAQGFRRIFFYDDNFTTDRAWARELLGRLAPMGLRFNAQVRADFAWQDAARRRRDDALLRAMRKAGGDVFYIGYETVDEATARQWHKGYQGEGSLRSRLLEDTAVLHDHGFWIHGMFVLGPQHTEGTARQIVDFTHDSRLESMQISILTPFPGTPLMEQIRPHLVLKEFPGDWNYYDGAHCVYDHGRLGLERLQRVVLDAHQRFYRWGAWNLGRLRAMIEDRIPVRDKLALLWANARIAGATLRAWEEETRTFLETVRARTARLMPAGACPSSVGL
jgi:radical SAM superfamily enzyme YgiQ (UPF0313 family)